MTLMYFACPPPVNASTSLSPWARAVAMSPRISGALEATCAAV
jgi:hypothetical protein